MILFPQNVQTELDAIAAAAESRSKLRDQLKHDMEVESATERKRIDHEAKVKLKQELDAEQTPTLEMGTLTELMNRTPTAPQDLIDGVVKDNGLCLVIGPSGSGKSTLALQMLHSALSGSTWLEQPTSPIAGSVGIVSYDMDASLVQDWMLGFPGLDTDRVSIVNAYKRGNPLGATALREQIVEAWKRIDVEVVVVDSFSASFFGNDQNDAALTMAHYRDLRLFALTEVGAKVLIVIAHSVGADPHRARGSTVHHDVADSIVAVSVNPQNQSREVRVVKYRAARGQTVMTPRVVTAPDPVTHLVDSDPGLMTLAGMDLPASLAASAFTPLVTAFDDPDLAIGEEDDDED